MGRIIMLLGALFALTATAQDVIDISGNNTSSSYVSYNKSISLPASKTVDVMMARYCYFSSTITGSGTLNLHAGGERCYLGTEKGASWPNWTNFKGDIHIFPFKENAPSAGFYGVVLAHGGKSFSPENIEDAIRSGKVNKSMENNHVFLHAGATICCEANSAGAGFRIGELQAEEGSTLQGYMKNSRAGYYLLGALGTDATLAGTIAPSGYRDDTPLGIIKEGQGALRITGNNDNCPNLVIWGLKDNDSWRSSSNPLLYTSSHSKKPAWYAVRSALRHRFIINESTGVGGALHLNDKGEMRNEKGGGDCKSPITVYDLQGRRVITTANTHQPTSKRAYYKRDARNENQKIVIFSPVR